MRSITTVALPSHGCIALPQHNTPSTSIAFSSVLRWSPLAPDAVDHVLSWLALAGDAANLRLALHRNTETPSASAPLQRPELYRSSKTAGERFIAASGVPASAPLQHRQALHCSAGRGLWRVLHCSAPECSISAPTNSPLQRRERWRALHCSANKQWRALHCSADDHRCSTQLQQ